MSARGELTQHYGSNGDGFWHPLMDRYRAEVLLEAAAAIERKQAAAEAEETNRFAFLDHETVLQGEAVRDMAAMLRRMADPEPPTPKQVRQQEDPHDSPLRHDYTTPHDLPEFPIQRDRRAI